MHLNHMKKSLLVLALFIGTTWLVSAQTIQFETLDINYGTIEKGSDPMREFHFTNTGNAPLIISNAQGSCGCLVPTWPREPIMPGQSGVINARYDTQRVGPFTKYITLTTNVTGQETVRLTVHGEVTTLE